MKLTYPMAGLIALGVLAGPSRSFAAKESVITAVYSSLSNGYVRPKQPDGSFKREYYAIAKGGYAPGRDKNPSIDNVAFPTITGLVAQHLARQNYYLAEDSKSADILLVINWGTSTPFRDGTYRNALDGLLTAMHDVQLATPGGALPGRMGMGGNHPNQNAPAGSASGGGSSATSANALAARDALEHQLVIMQSYNNARFKSSESNARLLGYVQEINSSNNNTRFSAAGSYYDDLISDLEEERYYVIVSAYDFRAATREKKQKLLWATRVSISARGNKFDEQLAAMLAMAGRQFGKDSGRLIRQYQEGKVNFGELKIMGVVPDLTQPNQSIPEK